MRSNISLRDFIRFSLTSFFVLNFIFTLFSSVSGSVTLVNVESRCARGNHLNLIASDSNQILGFAVILLDKLDSDYPKATIQEIIAFKKLEDVYDSLLDECIKICQDHGVNIIRTISVFGSRISQRLKVSGFVETELKTAIWLKPFNIGDELNNLKKISVDRHHIMRGFFDAI